MQLATGVDLPPYTVLLSAHRQQTGQLVANNYLGVCAEDKQTVICNPILYLSVKTANPVFLGVCFKTEWTQKWGYHKHLMMAAQNRMYRVVRVFLFFYSLHFTRHFEAKSRHNKCTKAVWLWMAKNVLCTVRVCVVDLPSGLNHATKINSQGSDVAHDCVSTKDRQ